MQQAYLSGGSILEQTDNNAGMTACTLVIPAYNEEARIQMLLSDITGSGATFLFICDGDDKTAEIIRDFATANQDMRVSCLEYPDRLGKGKAIREGLKNAVTPYTGYMDADGSTSLEEMSALLNGIGDADGVIGSRYVPGSMMTTPQGLFRRLESRTFNLIIRLLFGLPYNDTQCGAKVFKSGPLEVVLPCITSTGFEFDVELIWRMRQSGFMVKELPIIWQNRGGSRVKGQDAFSMFTNLVQLRFGGGRT
jgi:glycosyltransferase involved in cell wall biosynthesis